MEDLVVEPVALVAPERSLGDVPFSDHRGRVAGIAEHLGDRHGVARKGSAVTGQMVVEGHAADSGLVRVETREQRSPGRATAACVVESRETESFAGQSVEIRGLYFAAIAAEVRISEIVTQDHQNIGTFVGGTFGVGVGGPGGQQGRRDHHSVQFHALGLLVGSNVTAQPPSAAISIRSESADVTRRSSMR